MGNAPIPYGWRAERYPGLRDRLLTYWKRKHQHWAYLWEHIGTAATTGSYYDAKYAGLRCIHTHEGAWNANTGNGYYGGLQMDMSFQRAYGPEFLSRYGTANNWPAIDQLIAGYRAVQRRGYSPWPNTAVMCGLL